MKPTDAFLCALAVIIICGAVVFGTQYVLDTPDVIFSYSTGECRRVDMPDGTHGDCSHLPERYNHVWGK